MPKSWRTRKEPISFQQLMTWRHLQVEITQLTAQIQDIPAATPPSPLLILLVRRLRADTYRLVSREVGARALKSPLPDAPGLTMLSASLVETRLALDRFREAHSGPFSMRDDYWLVRDT